MSHFTVLVITDYKQREPMKVTHQEVTRLLAPYDESGTWFREEDNERPASKWDWWVIGGRWTGYLDGYDPVKDPNNYEDCELCNGTGKRVVPLPKLKDPKDPLSVLGSKEYHTPEELAEQMKHSKGCNGCQGKGRRMKFSVDRPNPEQDMQMVRDIPKDKTFFAFVTPDGKWYQKGEMGWWGVSKPDKSEEGWKDTAARILVEHKDNFAALVDCHV